MRFLVDFWPIRPACYFLAWLRHLSECFEACVGEQSSLVAVVTTQNEFCDIVHVCLGAVLIMSTPSSVRSSRELRSLQRDSNERVEEISSAKKRAGRKRTESSRSAPKTKRRVKEEVGEKEDVLKTYTMGWR